MEEKRISHSRWLVRIVLPVLLLVLVAIPAQAANWSGAVAALQNGMKQDAKSIDLSAYGIPSDSFWDQYYDMVDLGYFPWYVEKGGTAWQNSGYVTKFEPAYADPAVYNRSLYEQKMQQILDATVQEGMGQWQIALSIHDYLITNSCYDHGVTDPMRYTGYGLVVKGTAVCQGYSEAYMELMTRAGIPCVIVVSKDMNHSWNLVKIGSQWYHVDVTWDDPSFDQTKDIYGYADHKYFLISDSTMTDSEHNHYNWTKTYSCTDTRFESGVFWEDVQGAVCYFDPTVTFQRRSDTRSIQITRRDAYTAEETVLYSADLSSVNIGSGLYFYGSYGLSLWKGRLYFCDESHVYALELTGGEAQVVYTYNTSANGRVLQGCFVKDGYIYLTTRNHAGNIQSTKVSLPASGHTHNYNKWTMTPTCQDEGYTYFTCTCGLNFTSGSLPTVDHSYSSYTVTQEPTFASNGWKESSCIWCGNVKTEQLQILTAMAQSFGDVTASDYYYAPVLWAASRGVTQGTDPGVFSPEQTCTRAQVVTFLWRAMGEPEPSGSSNPFVDVKTSDYYYKAVLWAVEEGITQGVDAKHFGPEEACTRAQVVTFLYRTAGWPGTSQSSHPFTDVTRDYYYTAMLWAVEENITAGTSNTTFEPNASCTRAQIVTFLHRYIVG